MKRYHGSLIAFLLVFLVPCADIAASQTSAELVWTEQINPAEQFGEPLEDKWDHRLIDIRTLDLDQAGRWKALSSDSGPAIRALDPEEARRAKESPAERQQYQLMVLERDAILLHPINGRELVDRVVATEMATGSLDTPTTTIAERLRVAHLRRVAPNFVLPIATGEAGLWQGA